MIVFPNCKINLGLHVMRKRNDGFHDIETIFYPVPFHDVLEIIKLDSENSSEPLLTNYGIPVKGNNSDNLCIKAWRLLRNDFPDLPNVQIHLLKNIPMGAGLGGGSADAAFMIKILNNKFQLLLSPLQQLDYAIQLGSDCPFFINNEPCFAKGRGELMEPLKLDLSGYSLIIENPGIHIDTGKAFSDLRMDKSVHPPGNLKKIIQEQPIEKWKNLLHNDFEFSAIQQYPQIGAIKEKFYGQGAIYSAMSGSGSSVYGLFKKTANRLKSDFASNVQVNL